MDEAKRKALAAIFPLVPERCLGCPDWTIDDYGSMVYCKYYRRKCKDVVTCGKGIRPGRGRQKGKKPACRNCGNYKRSGKAYGQCSYLASRGFKNTEVHGGDDPCEYYKGALDSDGSST